MRFRCIGWLPEYKKGFGTSAEMCGCSPTVLGAVQETNDARWSNGLLKDLGEIATVLTSVLPLCTMWNGTAFVQIFGRGPLSLAVPGVWSCPRNIKRRSAHGIS